MILRDIIIHIAHGPVADVFALKPYEPYFADDTSEFYIGGVGGVWLIGPGSFLSGEIGGAAAGTITLVGALAGGSTVAAAIAGTIDLAGAVLGGSTFGGALAGTIDLAGAVLGGGNDAGFLTGTITLAGAALGGSSAAAAIAGTITLAGAVGGGSSAAAAIAGTITLAGAVAGVAVAGGAAAGTINLAGAVTGSADYEWAAITTFCATGTGVLVDGYELTGSATGDDGTWSFSPFGSMPGTLTVTLTDGVWEIEGTTGTVFGYAPLLINFDDVDLSAFGEGTQDILLTEGECTGGGGGHDLMSCTGVGDTLQIDCFLGIDSLLWDSGSGTWIGSFAVLHDDGTVDITDPSCLGSFPMTADSCDPLSLSSVGDYFLGCGSAGGDVVTITQP